MAHKVGVGAREHIPYQKEGAIGAKTSLVMEIVTHRGVQGPADTERGEGEVVPTVSITGL